MAPDVEPVVYIIDDDAAIRDAVSFLVGSVGYPCRTCASAQELLDILEEGRAACLVLDVRLPGISGLELQRELVKRQSTAAIVFITGHGDIPKAVRAIHHGAVDFLEKPFDDQVLLDRIDEGLKRSAAALLQREKQVQGRQKLSALTEREREVLLGVVAGKSSKAIAQEFAISVRTVENHRANLMAKAGVASVAQLIAWAKGALENST
jgi:FixJ family two-component response regulator